MKKIIKPIYLFLYYLLAIRFPTQPMPGYKVGYKLREWLVNKIAEESGDNIIVKQNCYIGSGVGLKIGDRSQLGHNARIGQYVTLGKDVVMGPDVVIMANSHAFDDLDTPINQQGALAIKPIVIGDDVWIGTRVIILPGVMIGNKSVIGAGSVVTKSIPEGVIAAGNPAKVIRKRGIKD